MRPCPQRPQSVTLQVCHSPSVSHPPRRQQTHSQLKASLTYPKITERGLPVLRPLTGPFSRAPRPNGRTERGNSRLVLYFIDSGALRFSVCRISGEALSGRDNSSAQAVEKGSGIGSLSANSSLSGPQGPGTFVEQSAVMAREGRRDYLRPSRHGHRSLHRPTHVPFSPIRSGIVPSLLGLTKIERGRYFRSFVIMPAADSPR